nr:recombinase family protein [Rothia sp. ZJ1223]
MERISPPVSEKWEGILRVAAYARISVVTERTPKSLATQIDYYSTLIQSTPGWKYMGVYSDEGKSGTNQNRAGFQELLAACRNGQIDLVLTKSISRFGRNTLDVLTTCRELKEIGVEVRFEKEGISTFSADGELMLTLLASFAQAESEQLSENVKWRVRKKFEQGRANGFHLYGYTDSKDGTDAAIVEEEAKVIRWVYDSFLNKVSAERMSEQLEEQGIKGRDGQSIGPSTIRCWLKNEAYTGTLVLGRWITPGLGVHARPQNNEQTMYRVENAVPAIIDRETFDKVQTERAKRRSQGAFANWSIRTSTFTSMIYCTHCQGYFRAANWTKKGRKDDSRRRWVCRTNRDGVASCPTKPIAERSLIHICQEQLGIEELTIESLREVVERIEITRNGWGTFILTSGEHRELEIPTIDYRHQTWTEERAKTHGQKLRSFWESMNEEERREYLARTKRRKPSYKRSPETIEKMRQAQKDRWTPEARAEVGRRNRERWAAMTEEEKAERFRRIKAGFTPEGKARKAKASKRSWTPERKAKASKFMREMRAQGRCQPNNQQGTNGKEEEK